jgi:hypothetical protein
MKAKAVARAAGYQRGTALFRGCLLAGISFALLLCVRTAGATEELRQSPLVSEQKEWRFRVFLDEKEIGYHDFYLEEEGSQRVLRSTAEFEYKLLFVKLYEYQHDNSEVWQDNCLKQIESSTDANGKPFAVSGQRQEGEFVVQSNRGESSLPSCVMSFAYWNPDFLLQTHLLNTQNGEFLPVEVSLPVYDPLNIRGETRDAWRYELVAGKLQLDLWYSDDNQWLGLASEAEGGRTLRYELL